MDKVDRGTPANLPEEYFRTPNVARMYDYYVGGKDNWEVDREAARRVHDLAPGFQEITLEGRGFLERAVRFLTAERGIRQFIDIGSGLPTARNVHEVAQEIEPEARVVYVDNDPVTIAHAQAILADNTHPVEALEGDMRHPSGILDADETRKVIDFDEPVAVLLSLILHFVTDDEDPGGILSQLRDAMAPGSYLVMSHGTADERSESMQRIAGLYEQASSPLTLRGREQVEALFLGFDLEDPGLVYMSQWRPARDAEDVERRAWAAYAGVGRKA